MKRAATITLPYTFCLFGAVTTVIGIAVVVAVGWYLHDRNQSLPAQAHTVLSQALDSAEDNLEAQFTPSLSHLRTVQQWLLRGELAGEDIDGWSAFILPQLEEIEGVRSITILQRDGALWEARRDHTGWSGAWREYGRATGAVCRARWDWHGTRHSHGITTGPVTTMHYPAALSELLSKDSIPLEDIRVALEEQAEMTRVLFAMSIGKKLGAPGLLALVLDAPVPPEYSFSENPAISIISDPGGERMAQLARSQTNGLLTAQAIPVSANLAFHTLFPSRVSDESTRWASARAFPVGNAFQWWSVAFVAQDSLPEPILPLQRYVLAGLLAGLVGALVVALTLGWRISRPLALIARRAAGIHAIDEHYLPWPNSRFTEVNSLTSALEDLYESAVEHLDYHDAPLVVWAQPEALSGSDDIVETQPLKRHINLRVAEDSIDEAPGEDTGPVINVRGEGTAVVPAAQVQVLLGSRKEVRRLQSQLAGVCEELRTAGSHFQQGEERLKRQRSAARALDKQLQRDSNVSIESMTLIRDCLCARSVSLWRLKAGANGDFALRISTESTPDTTPIVPGIVLRALLREELVVSSRDLHLDPRLTDLKHHPQWSGRRCSVLVLPLRFRGMVLGFILVEHGRADAPWKADEEAFAANCAIQCTMVLGTQHRHDSVRMAPPRTLDTGNGTSNGHANGNGHSSGEARANGTSHGRADNAIHWETDLAGCIKTLQGDVLGTYGYPEDALLGQPVTFLSTREEGERDLHQLRQALAGASCMGHVSHHLTSDGTPITLEVKAEAQRDATGRIIGVRGTAVLVKISDATELPVQLP